MSNDGPNQEIQQGSDRGVITLQRDYFPATNFTISSRSILINPACLNNNMQTRNSSLTFNLSGDEYLSAPQIAEVFEIPYDSLRKRLERFRNSPTSDGTIEAKNSTQNQPQYLYRLRSVLPEIEALQCGKNVHRNKLSKQLQREKAKKATQNEA